jgi:hypothetical protein
MIGPHEGNELELMLAGRKALAVFHDALTEQGISEEIIPEKAFRPHVQSGRIKRLSADVWAVKTGKRIRCVCFTLPGEEWRGQFVLWFKAEFFAGRITYDPSHDEIMGKLLGYDDADIHDFLERR